jgi:hypothetical protein
LNTRRLPTFPADRLNLGDSGVDRRRGQAPEGDEDVIQMNEVRRRASARVQCAAPKVISMIDEPGHPTGPLVIPFE